jgi:ClpP class serine protease
VFTSRVTAARGEKVAHLEEVAQGRLFTGEQAKKVGLVDEVGTLNDAVKEAASKAGLGENYSVRVLPEPRTIADVIREGILSDVHAPVVIGGVKLDSLETILGSLPREVRQPTMQAMQMLKTMEGERMLMAMPAGLVETH